MEALIIGLSIGLGTMVYIVYTLVHLDTESK
jgi:hypothetical protein